ncbi:MAG: DUF2769 domain-containing protein [Methanoregula sp.]|nr:DUF2769 domain-containing protein [Methanoregula sp.]
MKPPVPDPHNVADTEDNLKKCICEICPTCRNNRLRDFPPWALFCARGRSKSQSPVKATNCYCLACELFIRHGLVISHLCVKG